MSGFSGRPDTLSIQTSRQAARNHFCRCRFFFNKLQPFVFFGSYPYRADYFVILCREKTMRPNRTYSPCLPQIAQISAEILRADTRDTRRFLVRHAVSFSISIPNSTLLIPNWTRHPDHFGSASWITNIYGRTIQHLYYLPWGEDFVNQRTGSFSSMYTFSAKEKDTETGYSYFGSRYYSSDLSVWLSVDPQAAKYPSLSPYVYCYNNPILIKDPNGQYGVIAIRKQLDENGNVTGGTATLVVNYYYNSSMANSMTQEQAQYVENNIITNLNQLKGQKITIDGVQYTFDYQISFKDLATIYGSGNPEGWASADKYYKGGPKVGNYLQTVELDGGDVGQGSQYSIGIDFKKLKNYIASGRSDGQTPIHEFFHNLGAVDTFVYGTRIMDYNEQVNGEPVPVRKVQMEDIETLINQSNSKLGIVYEN